MPQHLKCLLKFDVRTCQRDIIYIYGNMHRKNQGYWVFCDGWGDVDK